MARDPCRSRRANLDSPACPHLPCRPLAHRSPRHPAPALPPRPALRRGLWALPLLLSLAFVAVVLAWLRANERADLELHCSASS